MFKNVRNNKISYFDLIFRLFFLLIQGIYYDLFQDIFYLGYFKDNVILSLLSFIIFCLLIMCGIYFLIVFKPLFLYLFKCPKLLLGEIYGVKTVSRGVLNSVYIFYFQIKYKDIIYEVYPIKSRFTKDFLINYGDCEELLKGKKVKFYISLFNKNKALIKKIIE